MFQVSMFGEPWREITKTEMMVAMAKAGLDVTASLRRLESGEKVTIAFVAFRKLETQPT